VLAELERAELPADAVEVGRIQDAWGIKGGFKVLSYSASPEALFATRRWFVQPPEHVHRAIEGTALLRISQVKEHGQALVVHAHDVPDRTAAETLKGARIFVPRSSFPSLPEGEYYWIDLIGLAVVNRQGILLGSVRDLISTGLQQVLVVDYEELGESRERLIPFVSAYVDTVDLPARRITVDWQVDY
jgi:16S rRNA processing protein RimM